MLIINSANYVISELQNEIGKIPPVFLPIGNKKFLSFQINEIRSFLPNEKDIYVSLPLSYNLNEQEKILLNQLEVKPIFIEEGNSLGISLIYILNSIGNYDSQLYLLHGDTLLKEVPYEKNCICISHTFSDYEWKYYKKTQKSNYIWCGFFSISSIKKFLSCLASNHGDFVKSVEKYSEETNTKYLNINKWYDIGHVNTYFNTRTIITTERTFNSLSIKDGIVWKSGSLNKKITAEFSWFKNLPVRLKKYTPQLIDYGYKNNQPYYETEYLSLLPLNEIFVHGKKSPASWSKIIDLIFSFMQACRENCEIKDSKEIENIIKSSNKMFNEKTIQRLQEYVNKNPEFNLNKPVVYDGKTLLSTIEIAEICINNALKLPIINSIMHGDLCFSNIMYDSKSENIKVIDPRGLDIDGNLSIYGNQIYDISKVTHSIIGMYDFIIADYYNLVENDNIGIKISFNEDERLNDIKSNYLKHSLINNLSINELISPTILLFLSMLPLHADKPMRQKAMLANAYKLFYEYVA